MNHDTRQIRVLMVDDEQEFLASCSRALARRGFHVDTDRNNLDFMPQIEPSPWARNLTEVW